MNLFQKSSFEKAFDKGFPIFFGSIVLFIVLVIGLMLASAFGVGNSSRQHHATEQAREYFHDSENISRIACMMEPDGTGYIPCRVVFQDSHEEMLGCASWAYIRTDNGCVPYRLIQINAQTQQFQQVRQQIQNGQNIQQQGVDAVRDQNQIISQ
jgi:uncharacterized membrane protein